MKDILRQVLVVLAVVATIAVNALANVLPFNGKTTGQVSDTYPALFTPAGYVFVIWGLIYAGLVAYAVYQAVPANRDSPRLRRVGYLFVLSCLANIAWIFLWHYGQLVWTIVVMGILLLLLVTIYLLLEIGRGRAGLTEKAFVRLPFSIYLGWISVATIANAAALLYSLKWDGWGLSPEVWTIIMLDAGLVLATAMALTRGDIGYVLVVLWAFVGIAIKQAATPTVAIAAWETTALVVVLLAISLLLRRRLAKG